MSNYPPGVTGNEWQIAGAPERVISADCGVELPDVEDEAQCNFSGDVDAVAVDEFGDWEWYCPDCGYLQITTIEPDDPPERERDW